MQVARKALVAGGVGVDPVGLQCGIGENLRPAPGEHRHLLFLGQRPVQRMVVERAQQCRHQRRPRHGEQHGLRAGSAYLLEHRRDVRPGLFLRHLAQEVVASDRKQHQLRRVLGEQPRQPFARLRTGVGRHARIDELPAGQLRQPRRIGRLGGGAGAEGQRVAERHHGAAGRDRRVAGRSAPARGERRGGKRDEQPPATHGVLRVSRRRSSRRDRWHCRCRRGPRPTAAAKAGSSAAGTGWRPRSTAGSSASGPR